MHTPIIIILLILSYNTNAEDCELVSTTSASVTTSYLEDVTIIGIGFFESFGPWQTLVGTFIEEMDITTTCMQCSTNFSQEMNEDFRNLINDEMEERLSGYDQLLESYGNSYASIKSENTNWQEVMTSTDSPVYSYLTELNSIMIADSGFMYPDDSGHMGNALVVLPYLANYISLRVMVLCDLFSWAALTSPGTTAQKISAAYSLYATRLYDDINLAIAYSSASYNQTNLDLRTTQISCNAGSPTCCGSGISFSCCGCRGSCTDGYCYDAVFDTPDTWRPDWHASGYPKEESCFYDPNQDVVEIGPGIYEGISSMWTIADKECKAAVTEEQNRLMDLMQAAVSSLNTAINNAKTAYIWMSISNGVASSCFTGDDLIELESGETVSFQDLEVGDKIATYFATNKTYGYSEIGFMAIYKQFDPTQYIDVVQICFNPSNTNSQTIDSSETSTQTTDPTETSTQKTKRQGIVNSDTSMQTNSSSDNNNSTSTNDIISSMTNNWPEKGVITPLGVNCVKLTKNHAVKMFDGSYKYAENVNEGDVFWPNAVVTDVSIVRDMGQLLIVPLPWDTPFLVLDCGIILSIFGYYGGSPPELQETHYLQLITSVQELCNKDNVSCSQVQEIYEGTSVLAYTFIQQTENYSSSAIRAINPTDLFQKAFSQRVKMQQAQEYMNEYIATIQNRTQSMINKHLAKHNITVVNGTYSSGFYYAHSDDSEDSSVSDRSFTNIKYEIIGISFAVVVAILVVIGIVYFNKTRKSTLNDYLQYS